MPLRSHLFATSQRLQSCLTQDQSHVVPGDVGDHVVRIQEALAILTGEGIDLDEMMRETYGPATTAAVLAYKTKNGIVNRAYQRTADNIVGKMTIQHIDTALVAYEIETGDRPGSRPGLHPPSDIASVVDPKVPKPIAFAAGPVRSVFASASRRFGVTGAPAIVTGGDDWSAEVLKLPQDLRDVLQRSNDLKTPANRFLTPILEPTGEKAPSLKELSHLIETSPNSMRNIRALYDRMKPFGVIWPHVQAIENVFFGVGAFGFKCAPDSFGNFLLTMKRLSKPKNEAQRKQRTADFCEDAFNVHGPRDSFREVVQTGPGLHICITIPASRHDTLCDLHIDEIQQGQYVVLGSCVPVPNKQTKDHVISVGPWLKSEAKKGALEFLKKRGLDLTPFSSPENPPGPDGLPQPSPKPSDKPGNS